MSEETNNVFNRPCLQGAIARTNSEILLQRRMLTVLESTQTRRTYKEHIKNDPEKLKHFWELFNKCDVEGLKYWLSKFIDEELGEMTHKGLYKIAARYCIPFYYRMTKLELIQGIHNARKLGMQRFCNEEKTDRENQGSTPDDGKTDTGSRSRPKKVYEAGVTFREQA